MRLYLDTNIFYLFLRPPKDLPDLRAWLAERSRELASGVHDAVTSPLVMDELAYRLLLAALKDAGEANPLAVLRADKQRVISHHGLRVTQQVRAIMALPGLSLWSASAETMDAALGLMTTCSLLPRDACHLAIAQAAQCEAILSTDPDFQRGSAIVPWLGPSAT